MTGFLQRLAERATGAVQPLRRVSSPLFAPSLSEAVQPPFADPTGGAITAAGLDRATAPTRQGAANPLPPAQDRARGLGTPADQRGGFGTAGETFLDHAATPRTPAVGDGHRAASQSAGPLSATLMPTLTATLTATRQDPPPAPAGPLGRGFDSPPRSRQGPGTDGHEAPRPTPVPTIEPLLPPTRPAPAPDRPNPAANSPDRTGTAPGAVQETTEVHVSIGRIEVTAVHEPAPARPAAPRRNAPMSLDDYLAKRHGGRT